MIQENRLEKIIEHLRHNRYAGIDELCKKLYCSKSTIRRDLMQLERASLVRRMRGGVTLVLEQSIELPSNYRKEKQKEKKRAIALQTHKMIKPDSTIFLDSSTTTAALVKHLVQIDSIKIITNSLSIAQWIGANSGVELYIIGGRVKSYSESVLGTQAFREIDDFFLDLAILSCKVIDEKGVYEADPEQALIKKKMMAQAKQSILMVDSTKFGQSSFRRYAAPSDFSRIITDEKLSPAEHAEFVARTNANVIRARIVGE